MDGKLVGAHPMAGSGADPDMIGALPEYVYSKTRIHQPHIRKSWLENGHNSDRTVRGSDEMVPVSWNAALKLVSDELSRVRDTYGHKSLFAGSYGWSSAGRFHHARTQIRRFFGAFGGFTDQESNYSWGAAQYILQHVLGSHDAVSGAATSWDSIADHSDVLVAFGGLNPKNWRVTSGGAGFHHIPQHIQTAAKRGTKFVIVSPSADDIPEGVDATWIAPRPGTDTALMLGLCHEMYQRNRAEKAFLKTHCVGAQELERYLMGAEDRQPKSLEWAARIADVPLADLVRLADMVETGRVMLTASWSLQRAHHGEQTYWAMIALAAILGQIGQPGGGFSFGYGSLNAVGENAHRGLVPAMAGRGNANGMSIPVARFADALERPGHTISFNGKQITFPDTRLIYWAGGNPFHHAQDLFRLERLWAKPETIIVHEQFWTATAKRADIVLPATTSLERNDIGGSSRDPHVFYMPQLIDPVGQARNDFDIFRELSTHLGCEVDFTESRNEQAWLKHLWSETVSKAQAMGLEAPSFEQMQAENVWQVPKPKKPEIYLSAFREAPNSDALPTPSGKIELASPTITAFEYPDVAGHPVWQEPFEWLGNAKPDQLALLSRQPQKFLHSQLGQTSLKGNGPPSICIHPSEASKRGLKDGDIVLVCSPRGSCKASLRTVDTCRPNVALMEMGHWYEGPMGGVDAGGNANSLTSDLPTSTLSQASAAQTCLVEIRKYEQ